MRFDRIKLVLASLESGSRSSTVRVAIFSQNFKSSRLYKPKVGWNRDRLTVPMWHGIVA
jgi:hypothetical protein